MLTNEIQSTLVSKYVLILDIVTWNSIIVFIILKVSLQYFYYYHYYYDHHNDDYHLNGANPQLISRKDILCYYVSFLLLFRELSEFHQNDANAKMTVKLTATSFYATLKIMVTLWSFSQFSDIFLWSKTCSNLSIKSEI